MVDKKYMDKLVNLLLKHTKLLLKLQAVLYFIQAKLGLHKSYNFSGQNICIISVFVYTKVFYMDDHIKGVREMYFFEEKK